MRGFPKSYEPFFFLLIESHPWRCGDSRILVHDQADKGGYERESYFGIGKIALITGPLGVW